MKKVLVTGANGFIGQHLCRRLLDSGYSVRGLKHEKSTLYFISENDIEFIDGDLKDEKLLQKIVDGVDIVYHLAAIPRNDISKTWEDFEEVNVKGTELLLKAAEKAKVKRFVFTSTVEAAGFSMSFKPRKEDDSPNPGNNYGKSKLEAEKVLLNNNWKMEVTVARLPMIYGPGTFLIVPKLFGMVKKGFYPFIGNGKTLMEFCYVGNAVEALSLLGKEKNVNKELFYISDERSYSIKEVVNAVAKSQNKKYIPLHLPVFIANIIAIAFEIVAKIIPVPPIISPVSKKPFFTRETVFWTTRNVNTVSTEKIRSALNYKPPYDIHEGCKITSQWFESLK